MKSRGSVLTAKTYLQRRLMWLILLCMSVPTFLLGGALLVQGPLLFQSGEFQDEVREELLLGVILLSPILLSAVIAWAFVQTNRIVGPVERMIQALDARIEGTGSGPVVLRPKDLLAPLADRINVIVAKWESLKKPESS